MLLPAFFLNADFLIRIFQSAMYMQAETGQASGSLARWVRLKIPDKVG
jgi:hypothetical protein